MCALYQSDRTHGWIQSGEVDPTHLLLSPPFPMQGRRLRCNPPTSMGSNALLLLPPPFPMLGRRRWCHFPTSTGSNAHLLLPDLNGEQRVPVAATVVPNARDTALVSLPDLNGEQRALVATTAAPNARETALVSPPDLNGKQRAPVAGTHAHAYARAHARTHARLHTHCCPPLPLQRVRPMQGRPMGATLPSVGARRWSLPTTAPIAWGTLLENRERTPRAREQHTRGRTDGYTHTRTRTFAHTMLPATAPFAQGTPSASETDGRQHPSVGENLTAANHNSHCAGHAFTAREKANARTHRRADAQTRIRTHSHARKHIRTRAHTHAHPHSHTHCATFLCIGCSQCKEDRWVFPPALERDPERCEPPLPLRRQHCQSKGQSTHADAQTRIRTHSHTREHTHTRTHTHTHAHAHAHTHSHTHCCPPLPVHKELPVQGRPMDVTSTSVERDAGRCQPPLPLRRERSQSKGEQYTRGRTDAHMHTLTRT